MVRWLYREMAQSLRKIHSQRFFPLLSYFMKASGDTALYCRVYDHKTYGLFYTSHLRGFSFKVHGNNGRVIGLAHKQSTFSPVTAVDSTPKPAAPVLV